MLGQGPVGLWRDSMTRQHHKRGTEKLAMGGVVAI